MPTVKLSPQLDEFNRSATISLEIASDATQYLESRGGRYRPIFGRRIELITELAFLKLYISWERFLEQSFIRFMCGAQNIGGLPAARFVHPISIEHALNILRQNQRYIDWTIASDVIGRGRLYFRDGEPISTVIGGSLSYLDEMKIIRNSIAHQSREVDKPFRNLVRQKMGNVPPGMAAGRFLMSKIPPSATSTQLEDYASVLVITANLLVS